MLIDSFHAPPHPSLQQMGNCIIRNSAGGAGGDVVVEMVKVVTSNGGVMELYAPITAACITDEFPDHAIFPSPHHLSASMPHNQPLRPGKFYYLLPIKPQKSDDINRDKGRTTPYRMSAADSNSSQGMQLLRKTSEGSGGEAHPRYNSGVAPAGEVWKVRLVICPDQLSEILSHEARTQALIESVRTVAKCSAGVTPPVAAGEYWR